MTRLWGGGLVLVVGVEVLAMVLGAHRWLLPAAGAAAALVLIAARMTLDGRNKAPTQAITDDAAESLQRWKSRTESTIQWADATRADWDRHLRPKLAAEFILATRHRDPTALKATGRIVFGDELWRWVDPSDISRTGSREPGPGSATLEEILRRMERL